jgi:hypothetical protein
MSKNLYFLTCFVLVLGLCTASKATTIDVNNFSFEYGCDGNQTTCHTGHINTTGEQCDAGIAGWRYTEGGTGWTGIDVNVAEGMCEDGRDWIEYTDGFANIFFQGSAAFHQIMDFNIVLGHMYSMSVDLVAFGDDIVLEIFALPDPCLPDANHIVIAQTVYFVNSEDDPNTGRTTFERFTARAVVDDASLVGKKLGIKIGGDMLIGGTDQSYLWADNVSLEWSWATTAYDPNPGDGDVLVSKTTDVDWKPGLWTQATGGHEVYFGTDETAVANADSTDTTGIYRTTKDTNDYTPTESPLVLGETYYWKITELNSTPPGGGVPAPPWEGDVWSFTVEGGAYDPSPANGEADVVFLGLNLEWTAGTEAEDHDVYFGTDGTAVANADTTDTTGIYKTNLSVGTETYPVAGGLTVGETYYWRIDENSNSGNHTVNGDIWSFTVGQFLIVDIFESYASQTDLWNVWDDYWVNGSDGEIFRETDVNIIREEDSNAVELKFENITASGGKQIGSQFDVQDMTEVDIGSDWTTGGVKALFLYLRGDPCNAQVVPQSKGAPLWAAATPWIELEDTSSNTGYVLHPSPSQMGWDSWNEWNIDLDIFDACGVDLTAIDRFSIGIGGDAKAGQSSKMSGPGYIYADDIRLYPPRCIPSLSQAIGDFTGDCNVLMDDVNIMATDWLMGDGCSPTLTQHATITMAAGSPNWTSGHIDGGLGYDPNIEVDVCDPRLQGLTNMTISAWIRRDGEPLEAYVGIVTSREAGEDATELSSGASQKSPTVGYGWNQIAKTWQFSSGIAIPDGSWFFMAMSVDPCGCSLYGQEAGGSLSSTRHDLVYDPGPLVQFNERFWIGRGRDTSRYFKGAIDDVRIYAYSLASDEIAYLGSDGVDGNEPDPNCPAYHYKFDEVSGLTATDDGCGAIVYKPVLSPANMTDPEPVNSRFVNFADYGILADNWMSQSYWP